MTPILTTVYTLVILLFLGFFGLLIIIGRVLASGDDVSDRVQTYAMQAEEAGPAGSSYRRVRFLRLRLRMNTALAVLVPKGLRTKLTSANWPIFETEYVLIRLGITLLGFLLGVFFSRSIYPGIGAVLIAFLLPGATEEIRTPVDRCINPDQWRSKRRLFTAAGLRYCSR